MRHSISVLIVSVIVALATEPAWADSELLFFDKFNNNDSGWPIHESKKFYSAIKGGKYRVRHKSSSYTNMYTKKVSLASAGNFTVETTIGKRSGGDDNNWGFMFGYDPENKSGYFFHIQGNGYCAVNVLENGKWSKAVIGGQLDRVVKKGNATNRFAVVMDDKETHFLLNNIFVGSVPRLRVYGDRIGFSLKGDVDMEVDSIKVYDGAPGHLAGAISSAKMFRDPGVSFHDMKILPYDMKPGDLFGFNTVFTVVDSKRQGEKVPISLNYAVLQDDAVLFEKTVDISVDANNNFTFSKKGLIAGKKKGEYKLKISIKYINGNTTIAQPFSVM